MQLKTYRASDLAGALAQARAELGPDALVLATNEIQGRLGLTRVEITVGVDRPALVRDEEIDRLAREVSQLRLRLEKREEPPAPVKSRATAGTPVQLHPALGTVVETLVRSGLDRDLALRFATGASEDLGSKGNAVGLAAATERAMQRVVPFVPPPTASRVWFVVGPPGAGKTTTVAKLASHIGRSTGRQVVLAEADSSRVGSRQQAEAWAEALQIPLVIVRDRNDLLEAVREAGPNGTVLVDTAGVGAADSMRLQGIRELRDATPRADVTLLLPSGLHREEARRVLQRFAPIRPSNVGLSKVDDGGLPGELVTAVASERVPLAFVTNGHRISDLEIASPRHLAALLMRSGFDRAPGKETHP